VKEIQIKAINSSIIQIRAHKELSSLQSAQKLQHSSHQEAS